MRFPWDLARKAGGYSYGHFARLLLLHRVSYMLSTHSNGASRYHQPHPISHTPSATPHQPHPISHTPSATHHQPHTISRTPSAAHHQPHTISHTHNISHTPSAAYHQPHTINRIPSPTHLLHLVPAPFCDRTSFAEHGFRWRYLPLIAVHWYGGMDDGAGSSTKFCILQLTQPCLMPYQRASGSYAVGVQE